MEREPLTLDRLLRSVAAAAIHSYLKDEITDGDEAIADALPPCLDLFTSKGRLELIAELMQGLPRGCCASIGLGVEDAAVDLLIGLGAAAESTHYDDLYGDGRPGKIDSAQLLIGGILFRAQRSALPRPEETPAAPQDRPLPGGES